MKNVSYHRPVLLQTVLVYMVKYFQVVCVAARIFLRCPDVSGMEVCATSFVYEAQLHSSNYTVDFRCLFLSRRVPGVAAERAKCG